MTTPKPIITLNPHSPTLAWRQNRRVQELAALYSISAAMNQALDTQDALTQALVRVLDVLQLDGGKIYLLDLRSGQLTLTAQQGDPSVIDRSENAVTPGECLCGVAFRDGDALQPTEPGNDPCMIRVGCWRHDGVMCAAVPLPSKDHSLGVMHVVSRRSAPFDGGEMALLRSVGAQIGVAVENMQLREEARRAEALETLIQEMHHRIKNNLQTVADLLSLEMSASASPQARQSLRDSIGRIKSIAAVHQLLSLEHLRLTDITELARQVCDISLRQLIRPDRRVEAEIRGPSIYLPSKQATALALAMNELIANALEHAFEEGRPGHLTVELRQDGPQIAVTVSDDGCGLPADFALRSQNGLGLQIARTLVEKDLAGTLELHTLSDGGSQATVTFYR
jgi:two-component system, sensor histidine kinase PdtaS